MCCQQHCALRPIKLSSASSQPTLLAFTALQPTKLCSTSLHPMWLPCMQGADLDASVGQARGMTPTGALDAVGGAVNDVLSPV